MTVLLLVATVQAASPQDTIDHAKKAANDDNATQHTVDKAKIAAETQKSPMSLIVFLIGVGAAITVNRLKTLTWPTTTNLASAKFFIACG